MRTMGLCFMSQSSVASAGAWGEPSMREVSPGTRRQASKTIHIRIHINTNSVTFLYSNSFMVPWISFLGSDRTAKDSCGAPPKLRKPLPILHSFHSVILDSFVENFQKCATLSFFPPPDSRSPSVPNLHPLATGSRLSPHSHSFSPPLPLSTSCLLF